MSKPTKTNVQTGADGKPDAKTFDRRSFFKLGGSAVATAAIIPLTGEAEAAESDSEAKKARYKETDHVKNFYRVNRY